jgi:ATP dependent DNA ligase domain
MPEKTKAAFIEPMLLLRTEKLPEGADWLVELKLDGYRALAIKTAGTVQLRSRNDNDFSARYPGIVKALAKMPDDTVIDGEVVALDADGGPERPFARADPSERPARASMNRTLLRRLDQLEQRVPPAGPPQTITLSFISSNGELTGTRVRLYETDRYIRRRES